MNLFSKTALLAIALVSHAAFATSPIPYTTDMVCGTISNDNAPYGQIDQEGDSGYSIRVNCAMDRKLTKNDPIMAIDELGYNAQSAGARKARINDYNRNLAKFGVEKGNPNPRNNHAFACFKGRMSSNPCKTGEKKAKLFIVTKMSSAEADAMMSAYLKDGSLPLDTTEERVAGEQ